MAIKLLPLDELLRVAESLSEISGTASEYIEEAQAMDAEEILAAFVANCMVTRFFSPDTGYYFSAPIPLSEAADIGEAYREIYAYCLREAIPAVIVGVLGEDLEIATEGYTSAVVTEIDEGEYVVAIENECMRCEYFPEAMGERIYLGELCAPYAEDYARLLEDKELNKYYGYDITEDITDASPMDYIEAARLEFDRGESVTLAATVLSDAGENVFVGEGVLYAFDGKGSASCAFRVLPEHQGRGYGREIFLALLEIAEKMGLTSVECDVKGENTPSLRLLSAFAEPTLQDGGAHFSVPIPFI